jgi:hypothetical protein
MSLYTMGIDPGKTGAAVLLCDGAWCDVVDWTTGPEVARTVGLWLDLYAVALAALEDVNARPTFRGGERIQMGGKSATTFLKVAGWWEGYLDAKEVPWRPVPVGTWTRGVVPKKSTPSDKPGLLVARRLYPMAPLHLAKHHNRADAALIARWAWMQLTGRDR